MSSIDNIENRIRQIEQRIDRGPSINSSAFQALMADQTKSQPKTLGAQQSQCNPMNALNQGALFNRMDLKHIQAAPTAEVIPLAQSNSVSCGQTSVAMCLNALTGKSFTDVDVNQKHGFQLLNALKSESREAGYDWHDAGNITKDSWATIDEKVNQEKLPVMVALNGPEFSASGRGHIVTIVKTEGDNVTYADPATGHLKTTTKDAMQNAPSHPDGNFVFVADRLNATPPQTPASLPMASNDGFTSF